jgi:glycosyltransferase involved in cell wall biosynthesis
LRLLHVSVVVGALTAQYNEHCLPLANERDISICSFFNASITPPDEITLFEGDGTLRGFVGALKSALVQGPYDAVHAHAPQTAAILVLVDLALKGSMDNGVLTVHNSFRNLRLKNQILLFPVSFFFDHIVLCSYAALRSLPRPLRWVMRGKTSVIQNGVDIDRVDAALATVGGTRTRDRFVVASAGRLIPRKNVATTLRAFHRLGDVNSDLVYVGNGESGPGLVEEVGRRGLQGRVTVTGLVERDDVYRYIATSDVYVSTSFGEGLPVAVLEAMACGTPVILSDIPPHREIAAEAGFIPLIPPDDVEGFARQLRRFKEMSSEQRAAIGGRCRKWVVDRFSLRAMHAAYEAIYRRSGDDS